MNIKDIAATLAILGSGALMTGCGKDQPTTEVPGGSEATPTGDAEAKCSAGHEGDSHCNGDAAGGEGDAAGGEGDAAGGEGEASCSAEAKAGGEGSCGGK